ncbi:MAG: hypothetical protein DRP71_07580 [Verrucomicrobia bacterium]|nr:MAG: hypothetical protein DRP71_07580 [Verrucomicrobiota bacterium]
MNQDCLPPAIGLNPPSKNRPGRSIKPRVIPATGCRLNTVYQTGRWSWSRSGCPSRNPIPRLVTAWLVSRPGPRTKPPGPRQIYCPDDSTLVLTGAQVS